MAQNGPHGHQVDATAASDDGHSVPPTTVVSSLMTSAGGSSAGNMGKNLIPDLNMEERKNTAGGSKDKEAVVEVAAADADADADKGKTVAAADDAVEPSNNIVLERKRSKRMKGLFRALQELMPHIPQKTDKVTIVGEAIQYIKALEEKAAMLARQALARQVAAARGEASSSASSSALRAMPPQNAQHMTALYSSNAADPCGWGVGGVPVPPPGVPVPEGTPLNFRTWSGQNVVLTVVNDNAYISVYAPRHAHTLTMVMAVLDNHGIDVITAHISSDSVRVLFIIFAHVTGINGGNRSSEEVYHRAASEIIYRLNINN